MSYHSVFRKDLFANEVMLVTGGGSGFGRCTAHELASLGATVVIAGRTVEKLEKVVAEIKEDGGQADWVQCDIRDEPQVTNMIATILERHHKLNGVFNNAGGQFPARVEDISKNGFEAVLRNNTLGTFLVSREAVKQYMKAHGGSIVCITADFEKGMPLMAHTGAARAGVDNFVKTAAIEWAEYGIRINTVYPGIIASSGFDSYNDDFKKNLRNVRKQIPQKRYGTESEVSAAVTFLMSPAASHTTGSALKVDGGVSIWAQMTTIPEHNKSEGFNGFHRSVMPECLNEND